MTNKPMKYIILKNKKNTNYKAMHITITNKGELCLLEYYVT